MSKRVFIVWERFHRRSELLAQHLGAIVHYIYFGKTGKLWQAPIRYLVEAWQTWHTLRCEQPKIIFVQNPPIFAVMMVFLYSKCYGAQYIIDSHTGAFLSSKWRWSMGLHRRLSSRALITIVHNKSQEKIVNRWGCRYMVLKDPIGSIPDAKSFPFIGNFNVVVPGSLIFDETLDIVFEAAAELPDITFYVSGDNTCIPSTSLIKRPDNCLLTGYLPYQQYVGLLKGADVVIDLVLNGDTLLCGAFEAVSAGTPLVLSDWPIFRESFPIGTVHVPNTVEGVRAGVRRAQNDRAKLRREILLLREQFQVEWMQNFTELQRLLYE